MPLGHSDTDLGVSVFLLPPRPGWALEVVVAGTRLTSKESFLSLDELIALDTVIAE